MDFLHYITESNDTGLRENSDHRLKDLHHKIQQIKASDEMEASFMKAEERERLIREKGREEGRVDFVTQLLRDGKYNATEISQIFGVPMEQIMRIRKEKNL